MNCNVPIMNPYSVCIHATRSYELQSTRSHRCKSDNYKVETTLQYIERFKLQSCFYGSMAGSSGT